MLMVSLFAAIVLFQNNSQAQFRRMSPDDRAKSLRDSLGLDSSQTLKVKAIYEDAQTEAQSVMESNQGDRDAMRSAMQTLNEKTDGKIKAILTPNQAKKYEEIVKNRAAMRNRMRGGN